MELFYSLYSLFEINHIFYMHSFGRIFISSPLSFEYDMKIGYPYRSNPRITLYFSVKNMTS